MRMLAQNTGATPTSGDPGADWWVHRLDGATGWLEIYGVRTALILIVALALYVVVARALKMLRRRSRLPLATLETLRILTRWAFVLLAGAALLQSWDVLQSVWAAATAVIALIAIGFVAVWSVLSNVMCSFILLGARPFRIGETVAIVGEEVTGRVESVTLLYTTLRCEDGSQLLIPNNQFLQKTIRRQLPGPPPTPAASEGENTEGSGV